MIWKKKHLISGALRVICTLNQSMICLIIEWKEKKIKSMSSWLLSVCVFNFYAMLYALIST